ncbi:MAG: hypothetical protein H6759_05420 [Candidatus Nomurabacteria bacterium]|nr:MAG: hypothetical protein H6759_05420 [Candidatus Nomurabacteria bacterium]
MTPRIKKLAAFAASTALAAVLVLPATTFAQGTLNANDLGVGAISNDIKLGSGDVRQTAARIINVALSFLGLISVVIVLIGGFKYMVSGGNDTKTDEAKKLITSGIIGLAIILSAWAITSFVISQLLTATSDI